ncbi:MAG TPA: beta-propeller domain-containing protein, partial [Thermoplasmata archaeon]|nr:beta-propeller domain-containing protein [Thermoplasmata archaeon]
TPTYSGTNVQVAGVDEADVVKTDGTNVYATTWGPNGTAISVLRAYPPAQAALLTRVPSQGWDTNLFLDGDRLVVLSGGPGYFLWRGGPGGAPVQMWEPRTSVLVYDVTDPAAPVLVRNVTVSGWYSGARMVGDIVDLVASAYLWVGPNDTVTLPTIWTDGVAWTLSYADLGYFPDAVGSRVDTLTLAVNVRTTDPVSFESFLTNGAGQMYASAENLYLASTTWEYEADRVATETSTVHKIAIAGGDVHYVCSVRVPGTILNQFSMDESAGDLRVATTFGQWTTEGRETWAGVYVFDELLRPLGQVDHIAEGERVFAARFLGDRAYLVTYRQVDPLFVLDLSIPELPRVLGFLMVDGVSDYLHPYGDHYLIGLGRGGTGGRLSGIKLAVYDVADVANPSEVASYVVGAGPGGSAWSEAIGDHHAFLFIPDRDLVVIPVTTYTWDSDYSTYDAWSGAYVFSVSPHDITLRGTVSHGDTTDYWSNYVRRSLYIGDYLYTISNGFVVANHLDTLAEVARIAL